MNIFQAQLLLGDQTQSERAREMGWDSPTAPSEQKTTVEEFEATMQEIARQKAAARLAREGGDE